MVPITVVAVELVDTERRRALLFLRVLQSLSRLVAGVPVEPPHLQVQVLVLDRLTQRAVDLVGMAITVLLLALGGRAAVVIELMPTIANEPAHLAHRGKAFLVAMPLPI